MTLKLFLCEKPDQGKNIAAVLSGGKARMMNGYMDCGNNIVVTWAIGHILEQANPEDYDEALAKRENLTALPIVPVRWKMRVVEDKKKQFEAVRSQIRKASEVVIACDAGREGELIAREILEFCEFRGKVSRLWLQALNKASIEKALASILPGEKTHGLYMAGLARARADWLIGMNMSRVFTQAYGEYNKGGFASSISVGRIQTPTLGIVVARDAEIEGFVEKSFFNLTGHFQHENGLIKASYLLPESLCDANGYCINRGHLEAVAAKVSGQQGVISLVESELKKEVAPLPYDLSTLQQEASKRLKVSVKTVLDVAQSLYEKHKIISYPRVDSRYLVESMFKDVPDIAASIVAIDPSMSEVLKLVDLNVKGRAWNTIEVEKSDHHAMMPLAVDGAFDMKSLSKHEWVVYQMIRDRFILQFAHAHEFLASKITVECLGERFIATGKAIRFIGWKGLFATKEIDTKSSGKENEDGALNLPEVAQDDSVVVTRSDVTDGKTKPPARFTEGTLLAAMENVGHLVSDPKLKKILGSSGGLGTPATRAATIEGLKDKQFLLEQSGKTPFLMSSPKGRMVIDKLPDVLKSPETTAAWEIALEQIEKGKLSYDGFMREQVALVERLVAFGKDVAAKREPHKFKSN